MQVSDLKSSIPTVWQVSLKGLDIAQPQGHLSPGKDTSFTLTKIWHMVL